MRLHFGLLAAGLLACSSPGWAGLIDFDDVPGPGFFSQTHPLTDHYASQGVLFAGPRPNTGGGIVTGEKSWPVTSHSGHNVLGFNADDALAGWALAPETITFINGASSVGLWVGVGNAYPSPIPPDYAIYTLTAYDLGHNVLGTVTSTSTLGWQQLVINSPGISSVVLSYTNRNRGANALVDDLSWTPAAPPPAQTPEPATAGLIVSSLAALGFFARRAKQL